MAGRGRFASGPAAGIEDLAMQKSGRLDSARGPLSGNTGRAVGFTNGGAPCASSRPLTIHRAPPDLVERQCNIFARLVRGPVGAPAAGGNTLQHGVSPIGARTRKCIPQGHWRDQSVAGIGPVFPVKYIGPAAAPASGFSNAETSTAARASMIRSPGRRRGGVCRRCGRLPTRQ